MSSSFRKQVNWHTVATQAAAVMAVGALPTGASLGADTYVVPEAELRAEFNDNFGLVPGGNPDSSVSGFIADAQALIGIATPRGETYIRPRLRAQEYPDLDELATTRKMTPLEAFLDLRSTYEWQRSDFDLTGRYSHEDSYNVETASGAFDPLDPSFDPDADTVRSRVGETRDLFQITPKFSYDVSERVRAGASIDYIIVNYDSEGVTTRLDYSSAELNGFVGWALSPVSDVSLGAFAGRYEAQDDISETESYGAQVGYNYRWSETTGIVADVFYEQSDITDNVPVRSTSSTSGLGGTLIAYHKQEVSDWRLSIGRRFIPTSSGRRSTLDQLRAQYNRDFSERLSLQGALRYETREDDDPTVLSDDRDYFRADLSMKWLMAPTWFVRGGYSYIWQDRANAPSDAYNNQIFIAIGYKGLKPK